MARTHTKYSQQQRLEMVAQVLANGGNLEKTAKELDIPCSSLKRIYSEQPAPIANRLAQIQKERFITNCWEVIHKALRRLKIHLRSLPPDKVRALTVLIQTLYEKQAHANLEPGSRSESIQKVVSEESRKLYLQFRQGPAVPGSGRSIEAEFSVDDEDEEEEKKESLRKSRNLQPPKRRRTHEGPTTEEPEGK